MAALHPDSLRRSPVERGAYGFTRRTARGANVPVVACRPGEDERAFEQREQRDREVPRLGLRQTGVYEVGTGMLVESRQELTGEFRLRFNREGSTQPPVTGTQKLTVTTTTRRA